LGPEAEVAVGSGAADAALEPTDTGGNGDQPPETEDTDAEASAEEGDADQRESDGGIEDDTDEPLHDPLAEGGAAATRAELRKLQRAAGCHVVTGGIPNVLRAIDRRVKYSLFVVGNVYKAKPHAAQQRLARDLRSVLADNFTTAVVATDEIKGRYRVGRRDIMVALAQIAIVVLVYLLVFTNQELILGFIGDSKTKTTIMRALTAVSLVCFVPIMARLYGSSAARILKMFGIE
ncbi:hypothetical protein ACFL59_10355, partial [Planctomycetota bacterium]